MLAKDAKHLGDKSGWQRRDGWLADKCPRERTSPDIYYPLAIPCDHVICNMWIMWYVVLRPCLHGSICKISLEPPPMRSLRRACPATVGDPRRNADVCLIPEMNINLEKLMDYVTEVTWPWDRYWYFRGFVWGGPTHWSTLTSKYGCVMSPYLRLCFTHGTCKNGLGRCCIWKREFWPCQI